MRKFQPLFELVRGFSVIRDVIIGVRIGAGLRLDMGILGWDR